MKFCWCTMKVKDMDESINFFQEIVGLSVDRRFKAGPTDEIAFLGNGETKVELLCNGTKKDVDIGRDISLGFEVDSVDKMIEFIKVKGLEVESGPFQPNPHVKFFYVKDPNGARIQFVENM